MPAPTTHTSALMSVASAGRDGISAFVIQTEAVAPEPLFMLSSPFVLFIFSETPWLTHSGLCWFQACTNPGNTFGGERFAVRGRLRQPPSISIPGSGSRNPETHPAAAGSGHRATIG